MVDRLIRVVASLCRWGNHGWDEAMKLRLRDLYRRFYALQELIQDEKDSMPSGPPGTKM